MAELTADQTKQLLSARTDIASNKYYAKNTNEWWNKYGTKEYGDLAGFQNKTATTPTTPTLSIAQQVQAMPQPTSPIATQQTPQYSFDPNQYLPEINKTAESIYGPQRAQLEAMRGLMESQGKQTEEKTYKDYQKRLQEEVDAINNRGAYFGGGAITAEADIRSQRDYEVQQQQFQTQANLLSNLTQQGLLSAQQAQYIQDQLSGKQGSAYQQYRDKVSDFQWNSQFDYNKYRDQVGDYQANRDYTFKVLTDERDYGWDVEKFMKNYNLDVESLKLQQAKFKEEAKQFGTKTALDKINLELEASKTSDSKTADYFKSVSSAYGEIAGAKSQEQANSLKQSIADQLDAQYGAGAGNAIRNYSFTYTKGDTNPFE